MMKALLHFRNISAGNLALYANLVLSQTRENIALFPDAEPYLSVIESGMLQLRDAIADAANRDKRQ